MRLELDQRFALGFQPIELAVVDELLLSQPVGVHGDRVAGRPERVAFGIGVTGRMEGRILPTRLWILAEIEHVVVVRVSAHAHRHQFEERGTVPCARALDRPGKCRRDLVAVGAVDRDPWNAVAGRLVGEDTRRRLLVHWGRERGLIVLDGEHDREPANGAEVDRLVPLAERRAALADEGQRHAAAAVAREGEGHAGKRQRADGQRRRRGQHAARHVAHVQILAVHWRPGFAHLRRQDHPDGFGGRPHRQRRAQIADDRRDDVTAPGVTVAELVAAPEPDARGVDRLLAEAPESLALESRVTVANLAAGEERLETIVGRAGQNHAAKDLSTLVGCQRRAERGAAEETVAGLHELLDRALVALGRLDSGRRLDALGGREVLQSRAECGVEGGSKRVERRLVGPDRALARIERRAHGSDGERKALDDKRFQSPGEIRRGVDRGGLGHLRNASTSASTAENTDRNATVNTNLAECCTGTPGRGSH